MRNGVRLIMGAVVAIAVPILFAPSASAVVIPVTTTADSQIDDGECGLREAITAASGNSVVNGPDDCDHTGATELDTITVPASGTPYELTENGFGENANLTGDLDVNTNLGAVTIDGAGAGTTTIDTEGGWDDRILQADGTNSLTISDLTITGGNIANSDSGGAIHSIAGALVLERVRVTANSSSFQGGGIRAFGTSLSITDSTIDNNADTGSQGAGGLYSAATTTTITRTVIRDNTATNSVIPEGGGMEAENTTLTMTDSVIDDNHLIDTDPNGAISGGGLQIQAGSATLRNTTISNNDMAGASVENGGGINTSGNLTLVNSTVSGNDASGTATSDGGGLSVFGGTTNVIQTTFGPNPVGDLGSAIYANSGTPVSIRGSVLETSAGDAACGNNGAGFTSLDDNVITDTSCFAETGNDDTDADPMLGTLLENGGTDAGAPGSLEGLPTNAPAVASTAIDHVPAANCDDEVAGPPLLLVDERGFPRPFDGDGAGPVDCDAGALEVYPCEGENANQIGTDAAEIVNGTPSADVIMGLDGNDTINAGTGADRICGNGGNDTLNGGDGNAADVHVGGPGDDDEVSYAAAATDVSANLATGITFGTGGDTIVLGEVENLRGGPFNDSFTGNGANNELRGGLNFDTFFGGEGDDLLDGEGGIDGARFENAANPIVASLQAGTASGEGADTLMNLENLGGSPHLDNLTGDGGPNIVEGRGGNDTVTGLGGADNLQGEGNDDSIFARDGVQDDVDCSGGIDSVEADQVGVDLIDPTCESVSFLASPVIPPTTNTPPPATTPPSTTPKCPKGKKLKKGKCVKKKRKK